MRNCISLIPPYLGYGNTVENKKEEKEKEKEKKELSHRASSNHILAIV